MNRSRWMKKCIISWQILVNCCCWRRYTETMNGKWKRFTLIHFTAEHFSEPTNERMNDTTTERKGFDFYVVTFWREIRCLFDILFRCTRAHAIEEFIFMSFFLLLPRPLGWLITYGIRGSIKSDIIFVFHSIESNRSKCAWHLIPFVTSSFKMSSSSPLDRKISDCDDVGRWRQYSIPFSAKGKRKMTSPFSHFTKSTEKIVFIHLLVATWRRLHIASHRSRHECECTHQQWKWLI